jgi:predicted transcriptional regulator
MAAEPEQDSRILLATVAITSAYVSNNPVPGSYLPGLIARVSDVVRRLAGKGQAAAAAQDAAPPVPAVSVKLSIKPDYLVCLEDGRRFKSLKRHLSTKYGMTPTDYRRKWKLPETYPMVAPSYAAQRSELARKAGLGRKAELVPPTPAKSSRKRSRV